jgi:hypothetical protein
VEIIVHNIPNIPKELHKVMIDIIEEAANEVEKAVLTALQSSKHTHKSAAKEAYNAVIEVHRRHQFKK